MYRVTVLRNLTDERPDIVGTLSITDAMAKELASQMVAGNGVQLVAEILNGQLLTVAFNGIPVKTNL